MQHDECSIGLVLRLIFATFPTSSVQRLVYIGWTLPERCFCEASMEFPPRFGLSSNFPPHCCPSHRTQWSDCATPQKNSFSMSVTVPLTHPPIRADFMKTCSPSRFINAPFLASFPISRESRFVPDFRFTRAKLVDLLSGPTDCY